MVAYEPGIFSNEYSSPRGQRVWQLLNSEEWVAKQITATKLGKPALEGVEDDLLEEFKEEALEDRFKQMIGHMCRQIMEAKGYVIDRQNVRVLSGAPFTTATRYRHPDDVRLFAYRNTSDPRKLLLLKDRKDGAELEKLGLSKKSWRFWKSFRGRLQIIIALGVKDLKAVLKDIENNGFHEFSQERLLRRR